MGHPVSREPGPGAREMPEAVHRGEMDALYVPGGNFLETMPVPTCVREALERVVCPVSQDYEQPGGGARRSQ